MRDRLTEETRLKKARLRARGLLTMSTRTWESAGEAVDVFPREVRQLLAREKVGTIQKRRREGKEIALI